VPCQVRLPDNDGMIRDITISAKGTGDDQYYEPPARVLSLAVIGGYAHLAIYEHGNASAQPGRPSPSPSRSRRGRCCWPRPTRSRTTSGPPTATARAAENAARSAHHQQAVRLGRQHEASGKTVVSSYRAPEGRRPGSDPAESPRMPIEYRFRLSYRARNGHAAGGMTIWMQTG